MRNIRLATLLSALSAGIIVYLCERALHRISVSFLLLPDFGLLLAVVAAGFTYLLLSYLGHVDPVVIWAARAWRHGDYRDALRRVRLFSWGNGRIPLIAFLMTASNSPDEAYAIAAQARLRDTDIEDPTYHLDFAKGRAALAQGALEVAHRHFDAFHQRFPGSAVARFAMGDLLLWEGSQPERARELLAAALADSDRSSLPHWDRLGFEAEPRASHAWSLATLRTAEGFQYSFDEAIRMAGDRKPVEAAVHLRLGFALRALERPLTARQHWRAAREADPEGWAGTCARAQCSGSRPPTDDAPTN